MAAFFTSARRPWLLGLCSFILIVVTWLWLVVCFSVRVQAWWNSTFWLFAGFAGAIVLALRGIRSVIGIVALLLAFSSFAVLFIIHFG
jgi:hypothetical protein